MSFQKTVLYTALIILVLLLGFIAIMLRNSKNTMQFPPVINQCPDYFTNTGDNKCVDTHSLANSESCYSDVGNKEKDFTGSDFQGPSGLHNKLSWAQTCAVEWDGITNNHSLISKSS